MKTLGYLVFAASIFLAGCYGRPFSEREKGTWVGALLGAGSGALIGSAVGHPLGGAAIGGAMGAGTGLLIGNELQNAQSRHHRGDE